ncbi:MAG TPA: FAD-dependent oxidoreductase, partial [Polyangiaceae bacterium]|nr:FAD-dependent oxidoreductase [Polyangiaceae bacterium]
MNHRVLVVGAGVAGTAAALAAARAGAPVTLVDGGTGASTLATGALDALFWQRAPASPAAIDRAAREALDALGGYVLPDEGARLLTTSGIARPARGHDAALLDVAPLGGARVGVVRCERPGWDAGALARAWGESFEPIDAVVMRYADERVLPDADFATRHDDGARLGWLAERLRDALARSGHTIRAIVLPPCLGVERPRARALSELVGVSCGEAIALPGGPSGLRFEQARDRALATAGIERVRGRATSVGRHGDGWRVATEEGRTHEGGAVVLATGGLIGGGIEYAPGEAIVASALPPFARPPFRLTVDAPLTLGAYGSRLELPGTLFGVAPESIAWPFARDALVDRVGVLS